MLVTIEEFMRMMLDEIESELIYEKADDQSRRTLNAIIKRYQNILNENEEQSTIILDEEAWKKGEIKMTLEDKE